MIELLTPAEMVEADRLAIEGGVPGIVLMESAGRAVADAVTRLLPQGAPEVAVVCGPGNNGGDGFVAGRILAERGYRIRMLLLGDREQLSGDAAEAARRWNGEVSRASPRQLTGADAIVDALFGAGLDRPVSGEACATIEAINASGLPVVAIDLPSGINGGSGAPLGAAVRAVETVTFFRRKPGHLLLPGRLHCGRVTVADIGIADAVLERLHVRTFANAPSLWANVFPVPALDSHKYSRGHCAVVTGGETSTGAARLAGRGALRAGAGLVTLASPGAAAAAVNAAASTAVMVRVAEDAAALAEFLADPRINAVVLGPGGGAGPRMCDFVLAALAGPDRHVVLDADAITSFENAASGLFSVVKSRRNSQVVLTPHEGEFARLFRKGAKPSGKSSKIDRALIAASDSGAIVLLKGADTVVASPDGRVSICENAPPWLATAGSGDVLAGIVAGLLAQNMPAFEAASAAVWLHAEAGAEAGPGLISEDLPDALRPVLRRLFVDLGVWP